MDTVKIAIPDATGQQTMEFPADNLLCLATKPEVIMPVADERAELHRALENPIKSRPISDLIKPGDKIAIVVSDFTRPTPVRKILEPVLEKLQAAGSLTSDNLAIVVACGLHKPCSLRQLESLLGGEILSKYTVVQHNADDERALISIGKTSRGIPVKINKIVAEADFCLSIGSIAPHQWAGFSGGAKSLLPGVAGRETINAHHKLLMDRNSKVGSITGNKFREQLEEAARMANFNFIVNVVLSADKKIAYAVAGDVVEAHRNGVAYVKSKLQVAIAAKADMIIASPGGFPRDSDLWQTEGKCLRRIAPFIRTGGTVIIVSHCSEGLGDAEFARLLQNKNLEELSEELAQKPFSTALAKAYGLAKFANETNLCLVSANVRPEMLPRIPIKCYDSLEDAVCEAVRKNPQAKTLIVPDTAEILLELKE